MTEEESVLIAESKKGSIPSFNRLVELCKPQAYNLALRMLGRAEAAEDATQDAFVSAWKGIGRLRGDNFRAWLLRIVSNACKDQLRSRLRHPVASLDALESNADNHLFHSFSSRDTAEEYAVNQELAREIDKGLALLPADQRLAVILCDIQGLSYKEISGTMGCSIGTVRSRISRGRAILQQHLLGQEELLPAELRLKIKGEVKVRVPSQERRV